jgi:hypothetical protein
VEQFDREPQHGLGVVGVCVRGDDDLLLLPSGIQAVRGTDPRTVLRAVDDVRADVVAVASRSAAIEARVDALASVMDEGGSRLRAFELRMQKSLDGLTGPVESVRRETHDTSPVRRLDRGVGQQEAPRLLPGELLDGLERQLQEAEGRLARLTATGRDGGPPSPTA